MPNRLNNQPPITAPTIPRAMSRKNPSPLLLTSLLPMKPAIRPSTIHAMIDMVCPPGLVQVVSLLDHLVRPSQHRRRDRQAERLGRLEVNHQLELRRLLHGEVSRFSTFQDLVDIDGAASGARMRLRTTASPISRMGTPRGNWPRWSSTLFDHLGEP